MMRAILCLIAIFVLAMPSVAGCAFRANAGAMENAPSKRALLA
jgi:hypothetical protein